MDGGDEVRFVALTPALSHGEREKNRPQRGRENTGPFPLPLGEG